MNPRTALKFSIGPIISACIGLVTLPLTAWLFAAEDVGRLSLLQTLAGFCVMIFSLDLHQAYVREYYESNNKLALLKVAISIPLLLCILLSAAFCLIDIPILKDVFNGDYNHFSLMLFICVISQLITFILGHLLRMQQRGTAYSLIIITPRIVTLFFLVTLLLSSHATFLKNILWIYVTSNFVALITCLWITRNDLLRSLKASLSIALIKKMLAFSTPLIIGGYAYWGLTSFDKLLVKELSGLGELGTYSIASSFAAAAGIVAAIFSNLWHPTIYKWAHDGIQREKILPIIESMLVVVCCIWSASGFFSFVITYLIPDEYRDVQYIFIGCLAAPLLLALSETTVIGVGISRKPSYSTYAALAAFATNILLNLLLTKKMGASGAAIAYAGSFFVFFVARTEATCHLWLSIPRKKMYFIVLLHLTVSIIHICLKSNFSALLWPALTLTTLLLYRTTLIGFLGEFKLLLKS